MNCGYTRDDLKEKMKQAVLACRGKYDEPIKLMETEVPKKDHQRLIKQLESAKEWQVTKGDQIVDNEGKQALGLASWGGTVCVEVPTLFKVRYKILHIDYLDRRMVYAIPVETPKQKRIPKLPGLLSGHAERETLANMADYLDRNGHEDIFISLHHPARPALRTQSGDWRVVAVGDASESLLLDLLKDNPSLIMISAAVLDAQLWTLDVFDHQKVPVGIYNIEVPKDDTGVGKRAIVAIRALTFTSETQWGTTGPLEITINGQDNVDLWMSSWGRVSVLWTRTEACIQPILGPLKRNDQIAKNGGANSLDFPSVPITLGPVLCQPRFVRDIKPEKGSGELSPEQQDLLRCFMSRTVTDEFSVTVLKDFRKRMSYKDSYRANPFTVWTDTIVRNMLAVWFSSPENLEKASALYSDYCRSEEEKARQREEQLQHAYNILCDPAQYADRIIDRKTPKALSVETAQEKLSSGYFAIRYSPASGDDAGKVRLGFSRPSLASFLKSVECPEALLDALLSRCEDTGLLYKRSHPVKLSSGELNLITFQLDSEPV